MRPFRTLGTLTACLLIAASTALFASPAKAEGKFLWTGFYVGGNVGYGFNDTKLDIGGGAIEIDGLSSDGVIGGVQAGYRHQFGKLVAGLEVGYTVGDQKFSVESSFLPAALLEAEMKERWNVTGILGYLVADNILVYGHAGWSQAKYDISVLGTSVDSGHLKGIPFGLGVEWMWADVPGLSTGFRYTLTNFDSRDIAGLAFLEREDTDHQVKVSVNYQFGANVLNQKALFPGK